MQSRTAHLVGNEEVRMIHAEEANGTRRVAPGLKCQLEPRQRDDEEVGLLDGTGQRLHNEGGRFTRKGEGGGSDEGREPGVCGQSEDALPS